MSRLYDVSVIVAQYNPDFSSVIRTIRSVIGQNNVAVQIIIADDGSKQDYFHDIESLFKAYGFKDYKFSKCDENCGTCINFKRAIDIADGKYIKPISPGDYLYDANTLHDWISFCEDNNIMISYGVSVYYQYIDDELRAFEKQITQPALNYLYSIDNKDFVGKVIDNIILCDCILGASYLCEKDILNRYVTEISGIVKYCEDFSYRLMLLDGQSIVWFDRPVIYYSYGDGISSKKDKNGNPLLRRDERAFEHIILKRNAKTKIGRKVQRYIKSKFINRIGSRLMSFVWFPRALIYRILRGYLKWRGKSKSCCVIDSEFVEYIQKGKD